MLRVWRRVALCIRVSPVVVLLAGSPVSGQEPRPPDVEVFTREGCPHCARALRFLDSLIAERPQLRIVVSDVGEDRAALQRLLDLAEQHDVTTLGVPAFHVNGELVLGFLDASTTGALLVRLLDAPSARGPPSSGAPLDSITRVPADTAEGQTPIRDRAPGTVEDEVRVPVFGQLSASRLGLPTFTVLIGLVDGFNPCAMWALIYLLSLLVNLHNRLKMFVIAGTFVGVGGLIYFAFIAAWFEAFRLIGASRIIQMFLGMVAVAVGGINLKDFVAYKKGISLSIPESAKPTIYARMRAVLTAQHLVGAVIAVAVLAVLINLVELLCTAGLPAVYTQILSSQDLARPAYYGYLGLYILAYVFDDSIMLIIAVTTLSRWKLQERGGRWLKLLSGAVMVALGVLLLVRPKWLL